MAGIIGHQPLWNRGLVERALISESYSPIHARMWYSDTYRRICIFNNVRDSTPPLFYAIFRFYVLAFRRLSDAATSPPLFLFPFASTNGRPRIALDVDLSETIKPAPHIHVRIFWQEEQRAKKQRSNEKKKRTENHSEFTALSLTPLLFLFSFSLAIFRANEGIYALPKGDVKTISGVIKLLLLVSTWARSQATSL